MLEHTSHEYDTPRGGSCQALDGGLQILARMIARHHLRVNSSKPRYLEGRESDDGNENKDLPDA
jgi:hypothetical protein